jgi:hypothetical protein
MKLKNYKAIYKEKEYFVKAFCEEEVFWAVLEKNGITHISPDKIEEIVKNNYMEIFRA